MQLRLSELTQSLLLQFQKNFFESFPPVNMSVFTLVMDWLEVGTRVIKKAFSWLGWHKQLTKRERELCENFPDVKQYAELLSMDNFLNISLKLFVASMQFS